MSSSKQGATTLRPVLVLVIICVVAGALLGVVHYVTAPVAKANADAREQELYHALFPEASTFEEVQTHVQGCLYGQRAKDASGNQIGSIVVSQAKGYGGQIQVLVAFDTQGTVTDVMAMPTDETPGLGTRVADDSYTAQYVGLPANAVAEEEVDFISGATISSRAVHDAFNYAVQAYEEVQ